MQVDRIPARESTDISYEFEVELNQVQVCAAERIERNGQDLERPPVDLGADEQADQEQEFDDDHYLIPEFEAVEEEEIRELVTKDKT